LSRWSDSQGRRVGRESGDRGARGKSGIGWSLEIRTPT